MMRITVKLGWNTKVVCSPIFDFLVQFLCAFSYFPFFLFVSSFLFLFFLFYSFLLLFSSSPHLLADNSLLQLHTLSLKLVDASNVLEHGVLFNEISVKSLFFSMQVIEIRRSSQLCSLFSILTLFFHFFFHFFFFPFSNSYRKRLCLIVAFLCFALQKLGHLLHVLETTFVVPCSAARCGSRRGRLCTCRCVSEWERENVCVCVFVCELGRGREKRWKFGVNEWIVPFWLRQQRRRAWQQV